MTKKIRFNPFFRLRIGVICVQNRTFYLASEIACFLAKTKKIHKIEITFKFVDFLVEIVVY
ncbi:hypothetical protein B0A79_11765 [Flavobacterium piscis]|uniref:Uncharacterized protein n=1 Tax=Flavobacterium piscis TaxID=1114874 RepID=A0ABX2XIV7_9FLAO|nr:hypothetical protein FLP_14720 [Flavobacterium piscis]OXG04323.1 hypothetical protein B0A79_11765 [Flavobacterium piscis]